MNALITSIVGIQTVEKELSKYSTVEEQQQAMERIRSKAVTSSFRTMICFVLAIVLAVVIRMVV